jgi:uncharacterized cupredoxin-like copper-binding protein
MNSKYLGMIMALSLAAMAYPLYAKDLPSFNLSVKDGQFSPEKVEVPAGQKFKLILKNEGASSEEFESHELNREKLVKPGKSVDIIIGPLKPGTYGFYGEFHPQTARGQIVAE